MTANAADVALEQLTANVERSHLLGSSHLEAFADWRSSAPKATAAAAVEWLNEQGWVTRWQGQQLLAGNYAFFLRNYKLVNRLGGGGMGAVFQAIDDRNGRVVAVKLLRKSALQKPATLERFKREIAALRKLRHRNIVAAYEAGQVGGHHYLVMEYIEGRDVGYWIARFKRLPIAMACEIARQAALGLDHAHRLGFLHRDVKPSNLIAVRKPDGGLDVRILDFGLARNFDGDADEARVTRAGQIVGTVDYLAPEQAHGAKNVDGRADVYGLGVTLFEMIAGRTPFVGDTVMARLIARVTQSPPSLLELVPDAPKAVVQAIAKSLAPKPEGRFTDAGAFAAALERAIKPIVDAKKPDVETAAGALDSETGADFVVNAPTPDSSMPSLEIRKVLASQAASTETQQISIRRWLTRRRALLAAGIGAVAVMVLVVLLSRKPPQPHQPDVTASLPTAALIR